MKAVTVSGDSSDTSKDEGTPVPPGHDAEPAAEGAAESRDAAEPGKSPSEAVPAAGTESAEGGDRAPADAERRPVPVPPTPSDPASGEGRDATDAAPTADGGTGDAPGTGDDDADTTDDDGTGDDGTDATDDAGTGDDADTGDDEGRSADRGSEAGADATDAPEDAASTESDDADGPPGPPTAVKAPSAPGPSADGKTPAKTEQRPAAEHTDDDADDAADTVERDAPEAPRPTPTRTDPAPRTSGPAKPAAPAESGAVPSPRSATAAPGARGSEAAEAGGGSGPREGRKDRSAPAWAENRPGTADSERTSEFVPLKELHTRAAAPAPVRPAPASIPVPAPASIPVPAPGPVPGPAPFGPAPLDLPAELTLTTRPARRTVARRVLLWTPVLLPLAGAVAAVQLLRPLPLPGIVSTVSAHTVDGAFSIPWPEKGQGAVRVPGSGDIGSFGEQRPVPTASVAKVMTAYVVLRNHPLKKNDAGPSITVDAKAVADGTSEHESRVEGLTAGTKYSQQDMLKMLMIPSGNNVARLLARWDTGTDSEAAFVEKMNAAARELGMDDTVYTDPSGLDAATVSTAADQLKLAEAVMKDEAFRAIVALPSAPIKGLAKPLVNNNDLLTVQGLSIRGIKTGSSTPAGGALMWAAYKSVGDETPLILGTLMDQHVTGPDPDGSNSLVLVKANSRKIIESVRAALAQSPVVRKGDVVGYVDDKLGGRTPLVAAQDLNVIGVPGQRLSLSLSGTDSAVPRSAKAGTEVGRLTVGGGEGAKSVPVAVLGELAEPSYGTRLLRVG
ncbi:serine hydrolase [Streptomyces sp. NPDC058662]|uniref:D-alanyl-D-alanine carboxypeptidase n=1 Tax=Streptomyces sp. NPDC058662 TaxID=3346583 RepID=UPI003650831C